MIRIHRNVHSVTIDSDSVYNEIESVSSDILSLFVPLSEEKKIFLLPTKQKDDFLRALTKLGYKPRVEKT